MFKHLKIVKKQQIARLILNRPSRLNALNSEMLRELVQAARWFDQQSDIRVVIISGSDRAFSAGADLKDSPTNPPEEEHWIDRRERGQLGYKMTQAISDMRAVTIAQVHGFAIGGAFLLVLACDLRIVAQNTFFSIPEVDLGIPLSWGGIPKLVAEIGPTKTKELVMTCRHFHPEEALHMRLINKVVPKEELAEQCMALAQEIAEKPSVPIIMTKEQVNAVARNMGAGYVAEAEGDMLQNVLKDPESVKAAQAYLEKHLKKSKPDKLRK